MGKIIVLTVVGQTTEKSARFRKYRKKKLNPSKSKEGAVSSNIFCAHEVMSCNYWAPQTKNSPIKAVGIE